MKLADYLDTNDLTHDRFAALIGTTQAAVSRYATGKRTPRGPILRRISEVTKGKVSANDFLPPRADPRTSETGVAA
jgi:predicted transcriptional regulator